MLSDPSRREVREEGNLLIEAVSLLVQRQRETESWIAEQVWQAEERATATERVSAEFEARLAAIEAHLARLVREVEPLRDDEGVDERLERLREQVEGLKSGADPRAHVEGLKSGVEPRPYVEGLKSGVDARAVRPTPVVAGAPASIPPPRARPRTAPPAGQGVGFWQLLGPSPQDRFGFVLIAAGAVAVLYAVLTQLRFG